MKMLRCLTFLARNAICIFVAHAARRRCWDEMLDPCYNSRTEINDFCPTSSCEFVLSNVRLLIASNDCGGRVRLHQAKGAVKALC
jgi:hypothetical protein